ncbi:hypothetical protein ACYX7E_01010 [Luteimonas sp. RIT-PG2_3]
MGRLLKDSEGRELLLGEGVDLHGKVLYIEGVPLFTLHPPVAPDLLDVIASLAGHRHVAVDSSGVDQD